MNSIRTRNIISLCLLALVFGMGTYLIVLVERLAANAERVREAYIERYLLDNPDVLARALDNVGRHLANQQASAQRDLIAKHEAALTRNPKDHSLGHPDAPITIVEFLDYNCGYCKMAFAPLFAAVRANPDVRLVFKEYPILAASSHHAAGYAAAIEDSEQYIAFHTALMNFRGNLTREVLDKLLTDMKLDAKAIRARAESAAIRDHLAATKTLATQLGITGTPGFIIGGKRYAGVLSDTELQTAIEEARARLGLADKQEKRDED